MTHQLQLEVENKEALQYELKGLRTMKREASIRILSSTPAKSKKQSVPVSQLSQDLVGLPSESAPETDSVAVSSISSDPGHSLIHPGSSPDPVFGPNFASEEETNLFPLLPTSVSSELASVSPLPSSTSPEPQSCPPSLESEFEESDCSLSERELPEGESSPNLSSHPVSVPETGQVETLPPFSPKIQQCCVKVTEDGDVLYEPDNKMLGAVMDDHKPCLESEREKYLLLETTDTEASIERWKVQ